jgi:hypothetical protein
MLARTKFLSDRFEMLLRYKDDPWARKRAAGNGAKKKAGRGAKAKGKGKEAKPDPYAELIKNYVKTSKDEKKAAPQMKPGAYPNKSWFTRTCNLRIFHFCYF